MCFLLFVKLKIFFLKINVLEAIALPIFVPCLFLIVYFSKSMTLPFIELNISCKIKYSAFFMVGHNSSSLGFSILSGLISALSSPCQCQCTLVAISYCTESTVGHLRIEIYQ